MGSFELKVTSEGIFHKSENITSFVEGLTGRYSGCFKTTAKIGDYDCFTEDLTFYKTGCEQSETKLSQWIDIWNKYQKIKQ